MVIEYDGDLKKVATAITKHKTHLLKKVNLIVFYNHFTFFFRRVVHTFGFVDGDWKETLVSPTKIDAISGFGTKIWVQSSWIQAPNLHPSFLIDLSLDPRFAFVYEPTDFTKPVGIYLAQRNPDGDNQKQSLLMIDKELTDKYLHKRVGLFGKWEEWA